MKKIIFGLFAISTFAFGATGNNNIYFRGEFSPFSKYKLEENNGVKEEIDEAAYALAVEVTKEISNGFETGVGIGYQWNGSFKYDANFDDTDGRLPDMHSIPIYATVKTDIPALRIGQWTPYLKGDLGFSYNDLKDTDNYSFENGFYYAFGIGLEIEELSIEVSYKTNTGKLKVKSKDSKYDVDSHRIMLGAALKFDLN
ncbi:hypothetical protein [Fusobacterium sp. MFO224]|uniref:hypothetical protein n=1 Tax=Fusobacterium sp. MFO224 TaxID=3378070 RepID=UPI003853C79E